MYQEGWLHVCLYVQVGGPPVPMVHSLAISASWKDEISDIVMPCAIMIKACANCVFIVAWSKTDCAIAEIKAKQWARHATGSRVSYTNEWWNIQCVLREQSEENAYKVYMEVRRCVNLFSRCACARNSHESDSRHPNICCAFACLHRLAKLILHLIIISNVTR